ncbi:capsid scaffolding serine peptidase GPO [Sphingomonas sp. PP-F2F-A104-K0414]|uniref:GPO family capsid scaffolding protein n=1 Tax=Sphingomonas sp. PP-F2F-A104-K0414 TaxID=2135661 RepID=UPI00104C0A07|nr:GPO family capsid scaffolding protein [Sphingomonas sp. PP-F2F-A104-K0414]TCP99116.1 capsid scaffolding serine peptidase GPO [Sphingomonas sp. PP-F2F-A104-K0414]
MAKSKFFRAFVSGATISDGRVITDEMIDQVVSTFNADTYSPRINVEHLAGYSPEPPFNGYGDVVAVKVQDDDFTINGKVEKRKALYCQVEGNDQLVALVKADQKPYPSVELTPSYAGTDKVGLIGLAFTDKPASIGTQRLQFSRSAPGTVFAASADAVTFEFEVEPTSIADAIKAGFANLGGMFKAGEPEKPKTEPKQKPANDNDLAAFAVAMGDTMATTLAAAIKPITDAHAELQGQFATLQAKLEATPEKDFSRTAANGGTGEPTTDC